ncbi:polymorphic toxin type 15 domain-containing protein [Inquilinus limosus]|uniref:polymorphic toxin type 15 domain-containing protein n=1 Tax=Inquilinus limosus TaxID=171674 RepID=UPI00047EAEAA|nr:polymorphic toxin type 15 domain-containing protein [Inquilinus limosus]
MTAVDVAGGAAGGAAGRWIGAAAGTALCGPICGVVGGFLGGRAGAMAGRALAGTIANMMEGANETQTRPGEATQVCEDCGEIDCFNPPDDPSKLDEFRRQLREQQETINNMKPDDLIANMDRYARYGRPPNDAADRQLAREDYRERRTEQLAQQYEMQGESDPEGLAAREVARELAQLNATHTLDLIAGGDGSISGLGDATVNKSLGTQWRGRRAAQLRAHAEEARKQGKRMNAELKECPSEGEGSRPADGPGGSGAPGSGAGDPGVPIS